MRALYPGYGFADHKGYGTPAHLAALKKHGPSPIHRRVFDRLPNEINLIYCKNLLN